MKINWRKVWREFDGWCDLLGAISGEFPPPWNKQKRKIVELVKRNLGADKRKGKAR